MEPPNDHSRSRRPPDDLLRKAREAVEKERLGSAHGQVAEKMEQGSAAAFIQRFIDACAAVMRFLLQPFRWVVSSFRGSSMQRIGRGFAWAAFERENGAFRLNATGERVFSAHRLIKAGAGAAAITAAFYIGGCAAYYYGTQFEELAYTTGKQEIDAGELYQFTGCTSLPCSTEADNGKYYKIQTSLFLPTLLYPEQDVYANIPQQNAVCHVKGYGFYFRNLRWLYKYAQWYQHAYDISCRPYNEQELAAASIAASPAR
ncbi:MAG: hypothetical protein WKF61_07140 [Luteimonas sp.]